MDSYISRQCENSRKTSNVFFVDSDGQLVKGKVHGLPSFEALLPLLAETPAMRIRKMEKAFAERERERQRRKAMWRAGSLDKRLPKAAPSKPRARF